MTPLTCMHFYRMLSCIYESEKDGWIVGGGGFVPALGSTPKGGDEIRVAKLYGFPFPRGQKKARFPSL